MFNIPYLKSLIPRFSFLKLIEIYTTSVFYWLASNGIYLRSNERKFAQFKDKHTKDRCFIIGNGPSLNKQDLTKLKNEITFGVNAIYTNYAKMNFYPTYYVVEDMLVAEDRKDEINTYHESTKFFGNYLRYCLKPCNNTILTNVIFDYSEYKNFPRFSKNALKSLNVGGTVSYLCIQLAYYMGFKEVYLIGFDHSYKIPKSVEVKGTKLLSTNDDVNHFSKDYFGKGKRWHDPRVDRMELSYKKAKREFEKNNKSIFNATAGGALEVFERVEFDSLFKE